MTKTAPVKQPECPECDKITVHRDEAQIIGNFLEWLFDEHKVEICQPGRGGDFITARILSKEEKAAEKLAGRNLARGREFHSGNIQRVLAVYFGIDDDKAEEERRALLDWVRAQQKG